MGTYIENERPSFDTISKAKWKELGISQPNNGFAFKQYSTQEMADQFFGGKPVIKSGNYEVYTDETDPIKEEVLEEVVVYQSFTEIFGDIKVKLFVSKDGIFLLERFQELTEPEGKTIVLFLEVDDDYNLHTVMHIRAGQDLTDPSKVPFADILNFVRKHSVTISPTDMKELLEKGVIANKKTFWTWLLKIVKAPITDVFDFFGDKFTEMLYDGAANFFGETVTKAIESIKVEETGWNPNPKKGEFNPVLIPQAMWNEMKPFYEHKASTSPPKNYDDGQKVVSKAINGLFDLLDDKKKPILRIVAGAKPYLPKSIYNVVSSELIAFFDKVDDLKKLLKDSIPRLQTIIYRSFTSANAYLCGIYNSLVDVVAGIFSIIGFFFRAKGLVEKIKSDPMLYAEYFLEIVEGVVEGIRKFDVVDFLFQSITFQAKLAYKLYLWIKEKSSNIDFTIEEVFYYFGYIVGLIIDIVVETLLTGGVADVVKLVEGVADFMKNPLRNLVESIGKVVKTTGDVMVMGLEFIRFIIKKLKEGSKALFEQLGRWMEDIFSLGEKVKNFVKDIYEEFFSPKMREYLEKLGLQPTKLEKGVFSMCPIS
ncbi:MULTISPECIES: hypothetical protein [unclassified Chryseobacterium]|uniref:hypothetical protein n=1 Tax=unclassified Chryseobacterium TaxID=2593645 RepID=UPI000D36D301|nr:MULTISPECIES: hypothetical protein [unclassified Chryseobacterium]PTT78080.1 hypothetical protein DBR25_01260 [Chryseobacterium sp. HMWF001]PVV50991.1 hypothetical protein DD829_20530 [Chryseobacterium sp. HMWF035]